jgi:EAL domain-containing protein (putative c-di-GMP-specific phosphodiesterase class I)/GGDEF domain-containing protein
MDQAIPAALGFQKEAPPVAPASEVEVEIAYSVPALLQKLQRYGLKPNALYANLKLDLAALTQLEASQTNTYYSALYAALKQWKTPQNIDSLAAQVNQLVFLWLNAIQDGADTLAILALLRCFSLKSKLGISSSAEFHCFLYDLVAETAQQHQQHQLDYALNYDAVTQLPNASQILTELDAVVKKAHDNQLISLFSIHFQIAKNNPIFSHIMMMSLSKNITAILLKSISADYRLYYSGNLQFDILIPSLSNDIQLNLLAAKLGRAFEQMVFLEHQSVLVTPFVGCSYIKKSSQKAHDLYSCTKLALESAISTQQHFVMYSDALQLQLSEQNDIENKVLEAFASDELTLFFQPIVNLENSSCAGAELLLRWSQKTGHSVHPSLTVEILNKVGKGKLFTRWLINSAFRFAAELQHEHKLDVYLTLNLRAEDLYDIELPHLLTQVLALWKISAKSIILEITENGVLEYNETTNSVINQLAQSGFRLALDDFGTGFSSLSRLRTMPIDLIKIDQSFVRDITRSKDDFEIVKSIAMLSNSLGKEVLAEGVEDKDCLDLIKKLNIHKCQGYYFAKPMPFEQFITWAKDHNAATL